MLTSEVKGEGGSREREMRGVKPVLLLLRSVSGEVERRGRLEEVRLSGSEEMGALLARGSKEAARRFGARGAVS